MALKFGQLMAYGEVNAPIKSHVLQTICLHKVTSKLQAECFFLQKTYGQQALQGADIW